MVVKKAVGAIETKVLGLGLLILVGLALLWKPLISKLFSAGGVFSAAGGLLEGLGGLSGQATEGVGYVLEAGEEGIEIAVQWLGNEILIGGDAGASVANQMQENGITAEFQIDLLERKEAGTLTGAFKILQRFITYEVFDAFWWDLIQDCLGDMKLYEVQNYATTERMQLLAFKTGGGYLG
jgi:hypothetical protein